jgi:AcrR family transcriptional regulator
MKRYAESVRGYIERARADGRAPLEPDAEKLATVLVWLNESSLYRLFDRACPRPEDDCRLADALSAVWRRTIHETDLPKLEPVAVAATTASPPRTMAAIDGRRPRTARNAEVRQAFIDATMRLLEVRRLEDLTVVEVIDAAGFSRPTFYEYFESKHSVVAALADEVLTEIYDRLWRPVFESEGPMTRELMIDHYMETLAVWREHQSVLVAAAAGWRSDPAVYDAWGARWQGYVSDVGRYIERTRGTGSTPAHPDAGVLAEILVWLSETVLYLAFSETPFELAPDATLAAVMSAVWLRSIHVTTAPLS